MITEVFWNDCETAYCSICGFGNSDGLRLNGNLSSQLVSCRGCFNKYLNIPKDPKNNPSWRQVSYAKFKELSTRHEVIYI